MTSTQFHTYFLLALIVLFLVAASFLFLPFLGALVMGAAVAIVFRPIYNSILKIFRNHATSAAFISLLIIVLLILIPLTIITLLIVKEAADLYKTLSSGVNGPALLVQVSSALENQLKPILTEFSLDIQKPLEEAVTWFTQNIGGIFQQVAAAFLQVFLFLLSFFYFLKDGNKLQRFFVTLSPLSDYHDMQILHRLQLVINSVIKGSLIIAVLQGALTAIAFLIAGIPNAALWGSVATIFGVIPLLGASVVTLGGAIFLLTQGSIIPAAILAGWGIFVVGFTDDFLKPKLIQRGMELHPLFVFIGVIGGIHAFGIAGFVLGPVILSVLKALFDVYRFEFKKLLEINQTVERPR